MQEQKPAAKSVRRRAKISPLGASPGTLIADPLARPPVMTLTLISPETWETVENATLGRRPRRSRQMADRLAGLRRAWPMST